ncbi:hypothetical protein [Saccharococcus caldoxylosilyticus]|uniref:hypothetical protein n=1 Tax=Saccharococcus caldoxylosilyticus TaxID=81408 RepID=UPI001FCC7CA1|nr:hypothetical protein [Parageobacillus caldoxylosilyticus]BDG36479.1 hypothetical protein PcaKH15_23850 [Parageobacillus caldoxylosilyticus]BDG40267.1 hypothetical protein PcaKH16_24060 [Parageobacillus caldoxylosilyticus]BDG44017.1 hypothetical protein PcaKH35_23620 [Parageobacillus caldoxylosilyticus]
MNKLKSFFGNLHRGQMTTFRCIGKGGEIRDKTGYINEDTICLLEKYNKENYEIYFLVNFGGFKNKEIKQINAVFVDLDCGRDDAGNYYSLDVVESYKERKLNEIQRFHKIPSYIVETRNGYHVYWLVEDNASIEQFMECEDRLIHFFDSDPTVRKPAQLMRVPNFYWCKDTQNKFKSKIIVQNDVRYNIQELIDSLPVVTKREKGVNDRKKCKILVSTVDTKTNRASRGNVSLIKQQNIKELQEILKPEGIKLHSHDEVYDYLKKQSLQEFLGLHGQTFNCIFHDDKNPSAGIIINEETGHHIYNCFSSNCSVHQPLTIIEVTKRLTGLKTADALRFLRKVYEVDYYDSEWQKEKKVLIEENLRLISSNEFETRYPEINSMIKRYKTELDVLHQLAIEHLQTENFTDNQGNPIFFASTRSIARKCGKDKRRVSQRISLFAYLGLIRKLPENEIPPFLLKKAKSEAAKKKQQHLINFYSIPAYNEITLQFVKRKVREYKERGFTMRGWSRELVLRTLGEDEADRVFPQISGKQIKDGQVTKDIERLTLVLIEQKGWTTEAEILAEMIEQYKGKKSHYEKRIKQIIPELIDKYGLCKSRLNKKLKQQLNVIVDGYPNIIYKTSQVDKQSETA